MNTGIFSRRNKQLISRRRIPKIHKLELGKNIFLIIDFVGGCLDVQDYINKHAFFLSNINSSNLIDNILQDAEIQSTIESISSESRKFQRKR